MSSIEKGFSLIESSYLESLTNSLWSVDGEQIEILLSGMVELPDMEHVSIRVDGETEWSVGRRPEETILSAEYPLRVSYRGEILTIGVLTAVANISSIYDRLWQDFFVILIGNTVKTFLVVGFVFLLFHRMVTRRLEQLAEAIKRLDLEGQEPGALPSAQYPVSKVLDEIDEIGAALRVMHGNLAISHQSVRERAHQLRVITDNLPVPIVQVGFDQCYRFVNRTAEEWLARPASELVGKHIREILGEETYTKLRPHIEATLEGTQQEFEAEVTFPDGHTRQMEFTYVPHVGPDGLVIGCFGLATDVSERHAYEERLRQSQRMEAVGQLTGGIAHEFNNMLQVVIGNLELLEDDVPGDGETRQRFQTIRRIVTRGADLTDRLLSFSRRQRLAPTAVEVGKVLAEMQSILARTLGETIDIEIELAADVWAARADAGQLENALLNLALNARDALPNGGTITLSAANVHIDEAAAAMQEEASEGDYVMIRVADDGYGMTAETLSHAFEPFFTTKDVGEGTGLGLSMVYGFTHQSGGFAEIASEPGQGTSVRLYLPRAETMVETPVNTQSVKAAAPETKTVLLVEDDPDVRQALSDQIVGLGYRVIEAADGDGALALVIDGEMRIDLLVTDIVMPGGLNGLELARRLRGHRPTIKVLYTTGYSDANIDEAGRLDAAAILLRKPYDRSELATALMRALTGTNEPTA